MNGGVSVVICCHNSAKRLPDTLRHLAAQQVPQGIPWEIVVVDNASTDDTAETAARCWPTDAPARLRVVSEPRAGIGNARFRGISEASYEFISFIDDDNWIAPDWIEKAVDFFRLHPEAAAVGGPSSAVFETTPPVWFDSVSPFYAVGNPYPVPGDITNERGTLLWTAGMSLRKKCALDLIDRGFRFLLCGEDFLPVKQSKNGRRTVKSGGTGEDVELCFALRASGQRLYYEPKLNIEHFMPAERLTWPKAFGLMRNLGEAAPLIELYLFALNAQPFNALPSWKKTWIFQLLKVGWHLGKIGLSHPVVCLLRPEGGIPALEFERRKSHFTTLWSLRGQYKKIMKRIGQSAWAQNAREN